MPRIEEVANVPDDEVAEVVSDFESEGATVVKKRQQDGSWQVTATFPDP